MKNGIESLGRVRLQGVALLILALAVGVLSGMALERVRMTRGGPPVPPPMGPQQDDLPPDLARLELTPDQYARIQEIFQQVRPVTDSLFASILPRLRAVEDSSRALIRRVLTAEQRQHWDESRMREPRGGMRPEPGPGPGPSPGGPPPGGDGPPPGPPGR